MPFRVGMGYDVHRFADITTHAQFITVCGVKINHTRGIIAHSDGDVAIHALTDALLGCVGAGDIGQHFPNDSPLWKDMSSSHFLVEATKHVEAQGYSILNFDITIICEHPKIAPHVQSMKDTLSDLLGLETARMSIKATTTEKLGFLGRGEGIAAHAVALCIRS
ncbi:2-C-methyl-D-erythritol 2,4-cyclodiphosphate synthase [Candidatus Anaplasma sp. TIGMIC]|uniref:2-C-methyl-D-erythritol 2,4-cyclodiphosphate synthase n=1 Tax=Candidatus Anaplasma sp. TIGMIC TaxID=3020713 RepID=UPI00232B5FAD|nr:2-C-methyl-D-erythritol 2,4-cyclodiphosphate synthase [Candidatus Anaplasma sp. TIGMIC]MDB1135297.1 2-C-methyl-D-erythritol 2,4-cyclodiphosphate synthase [Candidatus Anaplasma sp. TIGMIC]